MRPDKAEVFRDSEAGTPEKCDVHVQLLRARDGSGIELDIQSRVFSLFGDQIRVSVLDEIKARHLTDIKMIIRDQGALDYAIRARVQAAIERSTREAG